MMTHVMINTLPLCYKQLIILKDSWTTLTKRFQKVLRGLREIVQDSFNKELETQLAKLKYRIPQIKALWLHKLVGGLGLDTVTGEVISRGA